MSEIQEIARGILMGSAKHMWAGYAPALAEQVLADAVTIEGLRETVAHPPDTEALIDRLTTRIVELERLLWPDGRPGPSKTGSISVGNWG